MAAFNVVAVLPICFPACIESAASSSVGKPSLSIMTFKDTIIERYLRLSPITMQFDIAFMAAFMKDIDKIHNSQIEVRN